MIGVLGIVYTPNVIPFLLLSKQIGRVLNFSSFTFYASVWKLNSEN